MPYVCKASGSGSKHGESVLYTRRLQSEAYSWVRWLGRAPR